MAIFKIIVVVLLILIMISLGRGLWFLWRDGENSTEVVKSLTWRIGLSVLLFAFLLLGMWLGWVQPH